MELDSAQTQRSECEAGSRRERKGDEAPGPRRTRLDMLGAPRLGPSPRRAPPWEKRRGDASLQSCATPAGNHVTQLQPWGAGGDRYISELLVPVEEDTRNLESLGPGAGKCWVPVVQFSCGSSAAGSPRLWSIAMDSDLSYFSPQGEGGTRPALPQLPIRAGDLGLQVHTPPCGCLGDTGPSCWPAHCSAPSWVSVSDNEAWPCSWYLRWR